MYKNIRYLIILFVLSLSSLALAQNTEATRTVPLASIMPIFNPQQANQIIDKLTAQLPEGNLNDIKAAIKTINDLKADATKCVDINTQDLNYVNQQLAVFSNAAKTRKLAADKTALEIQRDSLTNLISSCQLFILRANKSIADFNQVAQQLSTTKLFARYTPIWGNVTLDMLHPKFIFQKFDWDEFIKHSGIKQFNYFISSLFFILLIGSIIGAKFLKRRLRDHIRDYNTETLRKQLYFAFLCVLTRYCLIFVILSILVIFTSMLAINAEALIHMTWISYGALGYLLFLMLARFFFYPPKPATAFISFPEHTARTMIFRLMTLASMCLVAFIVYTIGHEQEWNHAIAHLFSAIFITAVAINLISVIWLINRVPKMLYQYRTMRIILSLTLSAGLITIWLAEWLDYHRLALYLLYGIALTFISGFLIFFLQRILFTLLDSIMTGDHIWQVNIRYNLGIKKYQTIPEFVWLRVISYILLWGSYLLLLFKIWGMSATYFDAIMKSIVHGFPIVELVIVPSRIIFAGILFTILVLTTRWLRQRMKRRTAMEAQRGEKEALATITGYAGFSIALLFTLLIAGVNFAGLAVIAGALSVGIGFGLQNLAKDFISGLILLLERPVKIGDRIIVGQTEGYVKKISIRATHISTTKGTDVLVPNSEFTATQVTNLMFHDDTYRVSLPISVAYRSDTELVKQTLLEIANNHPDVILDQGLEPVVYFLQFGESTLQFELWCSIKDVNKRQQVRSELNYAIDKAFREHQIEMAFPQRDIHIRSWPKEAAHFSQSPKSKDA